MKPPWLGWLSNYVTDSEKLRCCAHSGSSRRAAAICARLEAGMSAVNDLEGHLLEGSPGAFALLDTCGAYAVAPRVPSEVLLAFSGIRAGCVRKES